MFADEELHRHAVENLEQAEVMHVYEIRLPQG
jgi:hypothetical protein